MCGKIGLRYEDYAKSISLSDYSKLKNSLEKVIRKVSRQSIEKQEVKQLHTQHNGRTPGYCSALRSYNKTKCIAVLTPVSLDTSPTNLRVSAYIVVYQQRAHCHAMHVIKTLLVSVHV